ncbi:MAG: hypothetical protein H6900_10555 [Rhodobacter sp.]|uniref:hypothetical protein n=1 Tax=Pararhodobacter sp. TaxID=2127056 RepID=UPI001D41B328|nr:hypothetical protein [Pararhodobacter sp.]MCB1344098.1 hypothetical protein [Paracoccaceae bacterium]MCC0073714.1 hypothetical protein [Rhodobacter sp.]HPD93142.1 hypothetical protein [Pararhodobacter sp.]
MAPLAAADELAAVRAQIETLRQRERALCAALIAAPAEGRQGLWTRVEVAERVLRVFDHRLLPEAVRQDPVFWSSRHLTELRCLPLDGRMPPAGPKPVRSPLVRGDGSGLALQ